MDHLYAAVSRLPSLRPTSITPPTKDGFTATYSVSAEHFVTLVVSLAFDDSLDALVIRTRLTMSTSDLDNASIVAMTSLLARVGKYVTGPLEYAERTGKPVDPYIFTRKHGASRKRRSAKLATRKPIICSLPGCGVEFVPTNMRIKYHSDECRRQSRIAYQRALHSRIKDERNERRAEKRREQRAKFEAAYATANAKTRKRIEKRGRQS